jgi:hypothetical protein
MRQLATERLLDSSPEAVKRLEGSIIASIRVNSLHEALLAWKRSHRARMTSQNFGSSSMSRARRPVRAAAISVLPLPPNTSRTTSPVSVEFRIARSMSGNAGCSKRDA